MVLGRHSDQPWPPLGLISATSSAALPYSELVEFEKRYFYYSYHITQSQDPSLQFALLNILYLD